MERKIIGFKLIKLYPLSQEVHYTLNGPSKNLINIYSQFPEFWEPIYEEVGVDLQKIYDRIFFDKTGNEVCDYRRLTSIKTTIEMMKEACRQTLELVKIEIHKKRVANYNTIDESDINNILSMIK